MPKIRTKYLACTTIVILIILIVVDQSNLPSITDADRHSANSLCLASKGAEPPVVYSSDGCSVFPDSRWQSCCIKHDVSYWCGGDKDDRAKADAELYRCVAHTSPLISKVMHAGVRLGGSPFLPLPWRWGYGYPYLHNYRE